MEGAQGPVVVPWHVADVSKTLQSVSETTGDPEGPGRYDVLFNNRLGVVVPAGIVDEILKQVNPLATYPREGNLYVADVQLSTFSRQDLGN